MGFGRFDKLLDRLRTYRYPADEQQLIENLLSDSIRLEKGAPQHKYARMEELSQKASRILNREENISPKLMKAINEVADNMIEAMGAERALVHTFLRHIRFKADGCAYDAGMEERLNARFERFSLNNVPHAQFITPQREGSYILNNWGKMMIEHLDGRMALDAYTMSGNFAGQINKFANKTLSP